MNETSLILDLMQGFTLKDVVLAIEELPRSLDDGCIIKYAPTFLSLIALLFSIYIYCKDQFKEVFSLTNREISHVQNKIYFKFFLDKLDSIYDRETKSYNYNNFNFLESGNYNHIIRLTLENQNSLERYKLLPKRYYINFFQTLLNNETLWIGSLYCLQQFSTESKEQKEFTKLWKKFGFYQKMTTFDSMYSIEEWDKMTDNEIQQIDSRIFEKNGYYQKLLQDIQTKLNEM